MSVPYSRAHAALRATGIVYVCLGFGTSAWLSRLPDVRDDLGLTPATIGTMLLIASLGSLLTLPTSGPIVTKIGARASGRIGVLIWALGIVCAGIGALNVSIPLATIGLVLLAAGNGLWGATMNIEAGLVQAAVRRTVVPIIQAMYAVGMLGGALLGALAAQMGLPLGAHLFGLAALELLACGTAVGFYLTKDEVAALAPAQDKGDGGEASSNKAKGLTRIAWREKQTVLIALMVMSAGLMEGAANDWLNLSMVDGYGYSTAAASAAFAFFLLMMTIVRFASPRLEARLGSPMLLRITFTGAVVGLLLVAFAPPVRGRGHRPVGHRIGPRLPPGHFGTLRRPRDDARARLGALDRELRRGPHRPAAPRPHRRPYRLPPCAGLRGSAGPPRDCPRRAGARPPRDEAHGPRLRRLGLGA